MEYFFPKESLMDCSDKCKNTENMNPAIRSGRSYESVTQFWRRRRRMFLKLIHMVGVRKSEFFSHISQAPHVPSGMIRSVVPLQA